MENKSGSAAYTIFFAYNVDMAEIVLDYVQVPYEEIIISNRTLVFVRIGYIMLFLRNCHGNYLIKYFRIKEKVRLNRPSSQCGSGDNSYAQLFKKGMVDIYLSGTVCQNSSRIPCMIPQAKALVPLDKQKRLQPCSSWAQYDCMLRRLGGREVVGLISSLQKDCKHKTIHFSNKKTHNLDDMIAHEVILILSILLTSY